MFAGPDCGANRHFVIVPGLTGLCGTMLVQRIKMFPCLLSSLEQGVDGDGDYPQVWTRNSPPGTSSEELHLRMLE